MSTSSPHRYRQQGHALGVPDEVLQRAIVQSSVVEQAGLPSILTLGHLAHRTGVPHRHLRAVVERSEDSYRSFEVHRKSGKRARLISAPTPTLMLVQRWILDRVLNRLPLHPGGYAYRNGRSIKQCATRHLGARWLVKADLHNFFHSIDERAVYQVFLLAGYQPLVSFELARICTRVTGRHSRRSHAREHEYLGIERYKHSQLGFLPQGSPTSGALANLVARDFDKVLADFGADEDLVYTRYADDIVFSSSDEFRRGRAVEILRKIDNTARRFDFEMHHRKSRIVPPGSRKIVLGLLVDGSRVRLRKELRSKIQNHLRGVEVFGLVDHRKERGFASSKGFICHFSGLLAFAHDIEPDWAAPLQQRWRTLLETSGWAQLVSLC